LEKAKQHLKELGAPEPLMPAFDESKFEPMPEVEINPRDEFYVDEESVIDDGWRAGMRADRRQGCLRSTGLTSNAAQSICLYD
jgi:hypothetical protein